jgi:peptidyl-prolyl cis-trans isomerase C
MRSISKPIATAAILLCGTAAGPLSGQDLGAGTDPSANGFDPADLPAVVAIVDGREVTKAELITEAHGAHEQLAAVGDVRQKDHSFYAEALDQIIAGLLIYSEAQKLGLAATAEEIDAEIARLRSRYPSEEAYLQNLAQQGVSEAKVRQDIQEQISLQNFVNVQVRASIKIPEDELRSYFDTNADSIPSVQEGVRTRHLLVSLARDASEEEELAARESIQGLLARARNGEDFAQLVRENSHDETAEQGGDLPWLGRGQTLPEFEAAAFALQPGQLSDVVRTDAGFHIIECLDRQEARPATFEDVRDQLEAAMVQQNLGPAMIQAVQQLEALAEVERFL